MLPMNGSKLCYAPWWSGVLVSSLMSVSVFRVVEFASYSEMRRAIDKLDNTELNGRRIRLVEDKTSKRRHRFTVTCWRYACFFLFLFSFVIYRLSIHLVTRSATDRMSLGPKHLLFTISKRFNHVEVEYLISAAVTCHISNAVKAAGQ